MELDASTEKRGRSHSVSSGPVHPYDRIRQRVAKMSDSELVHHGAEFRRRIDEFYSGDSIDKARSEGRLVYRSWPAQKNATADYGDLSNPKHYTSGYGSLETTRDPKAFRRQKEAFKRGDSEDPLSSAPATLLSKDASTPDPLWSGSGPGMVASLLPEEFYVEFDAINQRTKHSTASKTLSSMGKKLRAEVTRPDLFDNKDLSSGIMTIGGKTRRFGKPSMRDNDPTSDKVDLRQNAIHYQSFMAAQGGQQTEIHNEMAVKFRSTGVFAPALEMVEREVPQTRTVPRFSLGSLSFGSRTVPAESVKVTTPENTGRDTHGLDATLGGKGAHPVLKK